MNILSESIVNIMKKYKKYKYVSLNSSEIFDITTTKNFTYIEDRDYPTSLGDYLQFNLARGVTIFRAYFHNYFANELL